MEGRPLEQEDDAELAERARRGDVAAYERLVRRYQQLAVRTAYVITGQSADAQDAAQEAFVKAYYAMGRFRSGAPFRPWLLRIVANEAINRRRSSRRKAARSLIDFRGESAGTMIASACARTMPRAAPRAMRPHLPRRRLSPTSSRPRSWGP